VPVVTALRATRRGQIAVYVDDGFLCAVGEAAVARWRLHKGRELADDDLRRLVEEASAETTLADAYSLLGHRARSVAELRRRLFAKQHGADAVEAVLERLAADGLLDDAAFARSYVADKRRLAGWGTERIRRGLAEAGVAREVAAAALGRADAGGDPDDAELSRALDVLRRRGPREDRPDETARRRAYQLLLRRGFSSGVAYAAMRTWSASAADDDAHEQGESDA